MYIRSILRRIALYEEALCKAGARVGRAVLEQKFIFSALLWQPGDHACPAEACQYLPDDRWQSIFQLIRHVAGELRISLRVYQFGVLNVCKERVSLKLNL